MAVEKITISLTPDFLKEIESRKNDLPRSTAMERDLERLYTLYHITKQELKALFTEKELCVLIDTGNSTMYDVRSTRMLEHSIQDAFEYEGLAEKWGVHAPSMVEKISRLTILEKMCLVDFVERFWTKHAENTNDTRSFEEQVREIF